jgi:polyisoprenoid-binding protein YceI
MPWHFDNPHSRIGFIVSHFGLTFVHGYFEKAEVKLDLDEHDPTKSTVDVLIDAASMTTNFERRDTNARGEHYLEADQYPTITFKSKRIEPRGENRYALVGDFTLHGVTKELTLDTTYAGETVDARGIGLRGLAARASINRKDYGIVGSPVEPNVGEKIEILIDVELHDR